MARGTARGVVLFFTLTFVIGRRDPGPIDAVATPETKRLFENLRAFAKTNKFIFGQQRATRTGIYGWKPPYGKGDMGGWSYTRKMAKGDAPDELCDVKSITGDYPGLIGFNIRGAIDGKVEVINALAKKAYERGNIVAMNLRTDNPVTGGSYKIDEDDGPVLHSIKKSIPGGPNHTNLVAMFDKLADFFNGFKDDNGRLIPVIFRPFDDSNGDWYWYGQNNAAENSPQDYIDLYHFTVEYLRDTKHVHNLLYVFSPSDTYEDFHTDAASQAYLTTYPGDDYVDVMAIGVFDNIMEEGRVPIFVRHVEELVLQAEARNKIPAVDGIGFQESGINSYYHFWMDRVLNPLKSSTNNVATRLAYMKTPTNRCSKNCSTWVPYKGHPAEADFLEFYNDDVTVFDKDMPALYE